jgi:hypothetical protein
LLLEPDLTFEAQRIVPLSAYIQDIEVLMLHCQQKNAYWDEELCFAAEQVAQHAAT